MPGGWGAMLGVASAQSRPRPSLRLAMSASSDRGAPPNGTKPRRSDRKPFLGRALGDSTSEP
eukprot:2745511-Alexandrium_andersonii.AAC.1